MNDYRPHLLIALCAFCMALFIASFIWPPSFSSFNVTRAQCDAEKEYAVKAFSRSAVEECRKAITEVKSVCISGLRDIKASLAPEHCDMCLPDEDGEGYTGCNLEDAGMKCKAMTIDECSQCKMSPTYFDQ